MSITLIIHYCGDSREGRRQEYEECLRRNLANGHIQRIINLGLDEVELPAFAQGNPKVISHAINHRMTFRDAFEFANRHLQGQFVGIANLDTFLDDRDSDWPMAENLVRERNLVLCQSRIEFENDEKKYLDPAFSRLAFANAQDAWFFVPPVPVENIDFEIGTLGCDNALADRLKKAGKIPVNMGSRFKVFHYDLFRGKTGQNTNLVHRKESEARGTVYSRFPEREGCYLTPDFDSVQSVDEIIKALQVDPIRRYQIISDLFSEKIRIIN